MNQEVINKIEMLIEEASMREINLALQAQGVSPERMKALQGVGAKLKNAGKEALVMGGVGGLAGAAGGGATGGVPGAIFGASTMGLGIGLGSGIGTYLNHNSMSKMSPEDVKRFAKEGESQYGKEYVLAMRKAGSNI